MHSNEVFMLSKDTKRQLRRMKLFVLRQMVGFGEGAISANRAEDPEFPVSTEDLAKAVSILVQHRDEIIVPVEETDDGCGDGRSTGRVFQVIDGTTGETHDYKKSKRRAKIFGGGLQVAASMWRAVAGCTKAW